MEEKKPFFTISRFVFSLLCFAAFLVIGIGGYYMAVGEFVTARLAAIYAVLALVGAAAVLLRLRRFVLLYYIGCALGWWAGWFISGLKGDFAPTAGSICTFFLIAVFALLGLMAQWKDFQKRRVRKKEAQAAEEKRLAAERALAEQEAAAQSAELPRAMTEEKPPEGPDKVSPEAFGTEQKGPQPSD